MHREISASNDVMYAQISHLAKKAMISIADHFAAEGLIEPLRSVPDSRNAWANLGQSLGVCALQVSGKPRCISL